MEQLDTALDDIAGLIEAFRACADDARSSAALAAGSATRNGVRRELAAAADAYAASIMAAAHGAVSSERIARARGEAQGAMPGALRHAGDLKRLVEQRRVPLDVVRDDIRELLSLSLQCRAGLAAFKDGPGFDVAGAEPVANKVLVELREATLTYLARVRDAAGDPQAFGFGEPARRAAAETLAKTVAHAAELARLEREGAERGGTANSTLADGLASPLRRIAEQWSQPLQADAA